MNSGVKIALGILLTAVIIGLMKFKLTPKVPFHMEGGADPKFAKVGRAFKTLVENGMLGGSFAVYHKGKLVADVWGGYANVEKRKKWSEDTVSILMSCTKGVAAIAVGLLANRKLLSYDDPVAKHWPDFAQNGKAKVTIRQLLRHEAGLVTVDEKIKLDDMFDNPDKVGKILARQKPEWQPGTGHGYHMVTYGFYLDQLVRHVDPKHRSLPQFFEEEIAQPHDVDVVIGLTDKHKDRLAIATEQGLMDYVETISSGSGRLLFMFFKVMYRPESLPGRANDITEPKVFVPGWPKRLNMLKYPIASASGFGSARGLAKLYSLMVTADQKTGNKLLSDEIIREFLTKNYLGTDRVLGAAFNNSFSAGFVPVKSPKGTVTFGHAGFGGNFGYADPSHELSWALVTNHHKIIDFDKDIRYQTLVAAMYDCLD